MDRTKHRLLIGGKPEQYHVLKRLLRNSMADGRQVVARKLFDYLEQSKCPDTLFLFQAGLELYFESDEFELRALRFIQTYGKKVPDEAATSYYVKHGRLSEAYENLSGYLSASPYNSSAGLHGYAGWIAAELAIKDKRSAVKERYFRRALSHFDEYLRVLQDGKLDMCFLNSHLKVLVKVERIDDARILLESLIKSHELNIFVRIKLYELLSDNYSSERAVLRECIFGLFRLLKKTGSPFQTVEHSISQYLRKQLSNAHMKIGEFGQYLFIFAYSVCLQISRSPVDNLERHHTLLETCRLQFAFTSLDLQWKILANEFPLIIRNSELKTVT